MEKGGEGERYAEDFSGVLDRLDPRSREVLVLLWEGVGQAEVARRLGIEEALVAEIRAQGLGELRALFDEGGV
jgi:DNA-directed RNA polymerase specialized sigma24 family protein